MMNKIFRGKLHKEHSKLNFFDIKFVLKVYSSSCVKFNIETLVESSSTLQALTHCSGI
jgi:hypothetical protein